jgi:hypothetical protein
MLCTLLHHTAVAECTAASGLRRVPLLELYTSEGCDSCPPADRWISELTTAGYSGDRVVILAFHVDYWDKLGWVDRFGQARFSERQRLSNNRNGARVVYTPQLVLNGKDYRRGTADAFASQIAAIARTKPNADVRLAVKRAESDYRGRRLVRGRHTLRARLARAIRESARDRCCSGREQEQAAAT